MTTTHSDEPETRRTSPLRRGVRSAAALLLAGAVMLGTPFAADAGAAAAENSATTASDATAKSEEFPREEVWLRNTRTVVFDGTVPTRNPFPEVVSDAQLDTYFAEKAKNASASPSTHTYTVFRVTYRDGRQVLSEGSYADMKNVSRVETFVVFQPTVGDSTWPYLRTSFSAWGSAWKAARGENGGLFTEDGTVNTTTGVLNGDTANSVTVPPGDSRRGEPVIGMYTITQRQYLRFVTDFPEQYSSGRIIAHPIKDTLNTSGNSVVVSSRYLKLFPKAHADFHFVDDFAYRGLRPGVRGGSADASLPPGSLAPGAPLSERSAGTAVYSDAAFSKKPLTDLLASPRSESAWFLLDPGTAAASREARSPLLHPGSVDPAELGDIASSARQGLTKVSDDFNTGRLYTDEERELTEKRLLETPVPGYVYIDNDIDKKPREATFAERGNWNLSLAMDESGKILDRKHYYLTYRPIPRPVELTKTDEKTGKALKGATFDLFVRASENEGGSAENARGSAENARGSADELVPVRRGLTTDAAGKIRIGDPEANVDALKKLVTQPEAVAEWYRGIYVDPHPAADTFEPFYLMPGEYVLRETKAPEGYRAETRDIAFTVAADTAENGAPVSVAVTNAPETPDAPPVTPPGTPVTPPTTPPTTPPGGNPPHGHTPSIPVTGQSEQPLVFAAAALLLAGAAVLRRARLRARA